MPHAPDRSGIGDDGAIGEISRPDIRVTLSPRRTSPGRDRCRETAATHATREPHTVNL